MDYLRKEGYEILKRNYRFGHKEIDIIAKAGNTIVFVEVKAGRSKKFGEPFEKVDTYKQKKLIQVAQGFIQESQIRGCDYRFDVISVDLKGKGEINHLKNAFMVE